MEAIMADGITIMETAITVTIITEEATMLTLPEAITPTDAVQITEEAQ